jgi:hypothetical protein
MMNDGSMNLTSICLNSEITWTGSRFESIRSVSKNWQEVSWSVVAGESFSASCRITLPKTKQPFWCIPGVFWGDNQQDHTGQYYPRFQANIDVPRRFESSFWEFHVWRTAQPLVAMHDGSSWWILEVTPQANGLCASVGFEFKEGHPILVASLPPNERPYRNTGHDYTMPMNQPSNSENSRNLIWQVRALRIEGKLNALLNFLQKNYHEQQEKAMEIPVADYSLATRNALMKWHYHPEENYFRYTVAFDRVGQQIAEGKGVSLDRHEMALGWVSGWVVFEALIEYALKRDDQKCMYAVEATWERLCNANLVSPSGFWWTRFVPSRAKNSGHSNSESSQGMDGNWMSHPHHLHIRTLGDAIWRSARTLRRYGNSLSFASILQDQVCSQASLVADLARRGWPLPLGIDALTGEPLTLHGTAGMIWLSVWCELAAMGKWQDIDLISQGLDHYRSEVESGQLFGAPEDVGECMTSEDIYIAVNAYLDGYKITGRQEDLTTAIHAAKWLYLWRKSFNHQFDPRTIIGAYNLKSKGGDIASFKNNHLHIYGLDVEDSLLELSQLTGDVRWKDLADDHWKFSAQLTPVVDGQFNAYEGMVTEQFYFIDWSALGNSVYLFEEDQRRSCYDVGPHYRNHGNLAGFSHAWCTAFVMRIALNRNL